MWSVSVRAIGVVDFPSSVAKMREPDGRERRNSRAARESHRQQRDLPDLVGFRQRIAARFGLRVRLPDYPMQIYRDAFTRPA